MKKDEHLVAYQNEMRMMSMMEIVSIRRNGGNRLMVVSAKEATGLMGKPGCIPGNRHKENTILGVGEEGVRALVELGFVPCPVCKLEEIPVFREMIKTTVKERYGLTVDQFADKTILGYDAFRVDFERIVASGGKLPDRLYVSEKLTSSGIGEIKLRMSKLGDKVQIGLYDRSSPGNFKAL